MRLKDADVSVFWFDKMPWLADQTAVAPKTLGH